MVNIPDMRCIQGGALQSQVRRRSTGKQGPARLRQDADCLAAGSPFLSCRAAAPTLAMQYHVAPRQLPGQRRLLCGVQVEHRLRGIAAQPAKTRGMAARAEFSAGLSRAFQGGSASAQCMRRGCTAARSLLPQAWAVAPAAAVACCSAQSCPGRGALAQAGGERAAARVLAWAKRLYNRKGACDADPRRATASPV